MKKLRFSLIIMFCFALVAAVLAACDQTQPDHDAHNYGDWTITLPATCETAGERTRVCLDCEKVQSEPIEKLGHDWDEGTVAEKATCVEDGLTVYVCKRDGSHSYSEPIEKLGHDWQSVQVKQAPTCETPGLRSAACSRCDATQDEQAIPALNHEWKTVQTQEETCQHGGIYELTCQRANCGAKKTETTAPVSHKWGSAVTVPADCEHDGTTTRACVFGCGEKEVVDLPRLGHQWESDYTVEKLPTVKEDGLKSRGCTRENCTARDEQTLPKLDESVQTEYKITIVDPCGDAYLGVAVITIYDGDDQVAQLNMEAGGVTSVKLSQNNYKVKLSGLTPGYSTPQQEYDLYGYAPQLTITLNASLIEASIPGGTYYKLGHVIYDYDLTYFDENGEENTTSYKSILESKKGILLNFYFVDCPACKTEMPALVSSAKTNRDDVQVLMILYWGHQDQDSDIKRFQSTYAGDAPLWFVNLVSSKVIYLNFVSLAKAFPTTVLIDCNGQVVFSHVGTFTASGFNSVIQTNILDRYSKTHGTAKANITKEVAILPSRKDD